MLRLVILMSVLVLAGGCATMTSRPEETISITSDPSGADVSVDCGSDASSFVTPAQVVVARRSPDCTVTFQKAGFEKETAIVEQGINARTWGNLPVAIAGIVVLGVSGFSDNPNDSARLGGALALSGLGGLAVDALTGKMRDHDPKTLHVKLRPSAEAPAVK